ncbi:MAG: (d)CMP kinase [Deltaproteobacteria bacterium]|nr:(d)CMP kinase [Deltaproteobacteria bacterium]
MALVVALDGPAGAGKSSVARMVAVQAGLTLVDTGAIYRTVAWLAKQRSVSFDDGVSLATIAETLPVRFSLEGVSNRVFLKFNDDEEQEVTQDIRAADISLSASAVARHAEVRVALMELQRTLGRTDQGAVLEGRDIGTVVFPDADVKIYLTATAEERARRRALELADRGVAEPFDKVLQEVRTRDHQDMERDIAPLKRADDAVLVDCTDLTFGEVVDRIVGEIEMTRGTSKAAEGRVAS